MKIAPGTAVAVSGAVALCPVHRIPEDFLDALPVSLSRESGVLHQKYLGGYCR